MRWARGWLTAAAVLTLTGCASGSLATSDSTPPASASFSVTSIAGPTVIVTVPDLLVPAASASAPGAVSAGPVEPATAAEASTDPATVAEPATESTESAPPSEATTAGGRSDVRRRSCTGPATRRGAERVVGEL